MSMQLLESCARLSALSVLPSSTMQSNIGSNRLFIDDPDWPALVCMREREITRAILPKSTLSRAARSTNRAGQTKSGQSRNREQGRQREPSTKTDDVS